MPGRWLGYEIQLTQRAIRKATGITPRMYRPPVGLTNPHTGPAVKSAGLLMAGWDIRSLDRKKKPAETTRRVAKRLDRGSVIVLHDGGASPEQLCELVNAIIDIAVQRDMQCCKISEMIDQ